MEMLEGFCHFHSETGTEGGFWAFQDQRYIRLITPDFIFINQPVYDRRRYEDSGQKIVGAVTNKNEGGTVDVLFENSQFVACLRPDVDLLIERYSYKGLHILKNDDYLTIFTALSREIILWQGDIELVEYPVHTETTNDGWYIHSDQVGVNRETWFTYFASELPATLIPTT